MSEQTLLHKIEKSEELHNRDKQNYLPTFRRMPLAFDRGEGCWLWDVDGNRYLDALAGIAVNNLGYNHPSVTEAVCEQAHKLLHISNFFVTKPQVELSEKLTALSGLDTVFFSNSGTESFEGGMKIARKYASSKGRGGGIVSMKNSFHGRTLAAIASGKAAMQKGFGPMPAGFQQVTFNDIDAVRKVITKEVAAVVLEPVQGEGGVHVADKAYLEDLRTLCDEQDIVLIFDEIQCGVGRTGKLFAKDHFGVQPDIMLLAKALGNGVPMGAILSNNRVNNAIEFGDHGTTFGGNPLACASGYAVINEISKPDFLKAVYEKGQYLRTKLEGIVSDYTEVKEVRGLGLMIGMECDFEAKPLVMKMMENGVIANATAGNVLRLLPPLIISEDEMDELVRIIRISLDAIIKEQ